MHRCGAGTHTGQRIGIAVHVFAVNHWSSGRFRPTLCLILKVFRRENLFSDRFDGCQTVFMERSALPSFPEKVRPIGVLEQILKMENNALVCVVLCELLLSE